MSLSDTARAILTTATDHPQHIATLPERLPVVARRSAVMSMIKNGLLEEVAADHDQPVWRVSTAGEPFALRATGAGVQAMAPAQVVSPISADAGLEPTLAAILSPKPTRSHRPHPLRTAAGAILAAWDEPDGKHPALPAAIDALRNALTPEAATIRHPRPDTKRATVLALLRRPEGATVAQVADATGWATHTVRGFFAGLKKAGTSVEVMERVKQVGAGQGAKGSYTVYRVAEAG